MARNRSEMSDLPLFAGERPRFLTVSELNEIVKGTLESQLDAFWVLGEISNFRVPPSGHFYFTLKDDKSQIAADVSPPRCRNSLHARKRHGGLVLRPRESVFGAGRLAALCRRHGTARQGGALSRLRTAQSQACSRRTIRARKKKTFTSSAKRNWHSNLRRRRCPTRYVAHSWRPLS